MAEAGEELGLSRRTEKQKKTGRSAKDYYPIKQLSAKMGLSLNHSQNLLACEVNWDNCSILCMQPHLEYKAGFGRPKLLIHNSLMQRIV